MIKTNGRLVQSIRNRRTVSKLVRSGFESLNRQQLFVVSFTEFLSSGAEAYVPVMTVGHIQLTECSGPRQYCRGVPFGAFLSRDPGSLARECDPPVSFLPQALVS